MTAAQTLLARIKDEGSVNGQVIKVDRFLNHMVDPQLMGSQLLLHQGGIHHPLCL